MAHSGIWHILAYFIYLANGGAPKRRGARGSLPPTPPSWRAWFYHHTDRKKLTQSSGRITHENPQTYQAGILKKCIKQK